MPFPLPFGSRSKITLATPFIGEGPPLPFVPGFLSDAVLLYLMVPLFIRLQSVNSIVKSILTTNISTPQRTQFGFGVLLVLLAVSF